MSFYTNIDDLAKRRQVSSIMKGKASPLRPGSMKMNLSTVPLIANPPSERYVHADRSN